MAILDKELVFTQSAGVVTPAPITAAGTQTCQKVIDLGQDGDALGGHELTFHINAAKAATSGTVTVKAQWETCKNSSFAASDTKVIAETPAVPYVPNGGVMYRMKIMDGVQRFNRVKLVTSLGSGASITSGAVQVYLTKEQ